ncbi:hypothetical protein BaRGS_00010770 [Batillaria attramentaria]|uniref:Uncharacterized protein n=1 Tax=Batillaria attramentaria TaxID=370345 RepID=A0ABD0LEM9_9CAEN
MNHQQPRSAVINDVDVLDSGGYHPQATNRYIPREFSADYNACEIHGQSWVVDRQHATIHGDQQQRCCEYCAPFTRKNNMTEA